MPSGPNNTRALLVDSIGELASLFERASVVFMGGTLTSRGGHNILEPAYFSKPVIAGPHMENFAAIAEEFTAGDALVRIANASDLASAVELLIGVNEHFATALARSLALATRWSASANASDLADCRQRSFSDDPDRELAASIGVKAHDLAMSKRGVVERVLADVRAQAGLGVPNPPRTLAAHIVLTPLSWLWRAGHQLSNLHRQPQALSTRVISIGGLAMGGVGKTPVVAHLADLLSAAGKSPAILTRGYRRQVDRDGRRPARWDRIRSISPATKRRCSCALVGRLTWASARTGLLSA